MVRLKDAIALLRTPIGITFQFQSGAIKSDELGITKAEYISFNSKVVRLKVFCSNQKLLQMTAFQFQSGAIKRELIQAL